MAKSGGGPRFFKRRGDELTVKDGEGNKHQATLERDDADSTQEDGSFVLGYCKSCDWTGPARRARDKARKDALAHSDECPSKGHLVGALAACGLVRVTRGRPGCGARRSPQV